MLIRHIEVEHGVVIDSEPFAFRTGPITQRPYLGSNGQVGLQLTHDDGRVEYIYFNTSNYDGEGGPNGTEGANTFVYQGTQGDPAGDGPLHFYYIFDPADWNGPEGIHA